MNVAVIAFSPTPYRVELFDEVARRGRVRLQALYVHRHEPGRQWNEAARTHSACFLHEPGGLAEAKEHMQAANLGVISYFADTAATGLWRQRLATRCPWVFWGERPGAHHRGWLGRLARRWRLRHLHGSDVPVWAIGSWAVAAWRRELGGGRPIENMPYFSDLARFSLSAAERQRVSGRRRMVFTGSLTSRKGVDLLLQAMAGLQARHPGVSLTLAGGGELEGGLRQNITEQNLPVTLAGFMAWEQLPELYAGHDVMVVPSRYDGWGMVVPEGLASGMPVLATDHMGAALDLVQPGKNGWLCPAGDLDGLAACLEEAVSMDDGTLASMSKAALQSVSQCQLRHGAEKFEQLCLAAVSRSCAAI